MVLYYRTNNLSTNINGMHYIKTSFLIKVNNDQYSIEDKTWHDFKKYKVKVPLLRKA